MPFLLSKAFKVLYKVEQQWQAPFGYVSNMYKARFRKLSLIYFYNFKTELRAVRKRDCIYTLKAATKLEI